MYMYISHCSEHVGRLVRRPAGRAGGCSSTMYKMYNVHLLSLINQGRLTSFIIAQEVHYMYLLIKSVDS